MQQAELKQIRGIGDAICELLKRDHGINTLADLARLTDTEVDDLQRTLRAGRRGVPSGDVARWRDQARQLMRETPATAKEPLATFVVEAWGSVSEPGDQPHFIVHHIEDDETLETSAPGPTIDDAVRWMQQRVPVPAAPPGQELPAGTRQAAGLSPAHQGSPPPPGRGGLRITGLEVRRAASSGGNQWSTQLLADDPVAVEGEGALVFVGHVSLEGAEEPVTCDMRCRLRHIESGHELTFSWSGEVMATTGTHSVLSSAPFAIPAGIYRAIFSAADRRHGAGRSFRELPLLVIS